MCDDTMLQVQEPNRNKWAESKATASDLFVRRHGCC